MSQKYLKCSCASCGGRIEFPAEGIGTAIPCPHCGALTELTLESPPVMAARPNRSLKWIIAGGVILLVGAVAVIAILISAQRAMKQAQARHEARNRAFQSVATNIAAAGTPSPVATGRRLHDFTLSPVTIAKAGGTLVYAEGSLKNETDRQRFGVTVELEVFDTAGAKLGSAKDSAQIIEPRASWKFRALVVQKNAASARVSGVAEQ